MRKFDEHDALTQPTAPPEAAGAPESTAARDLPEAASHDSHDSLEDVVMEVYTKTKLYYYQRIFRRENSEGQMDLTALETFHVEVIQALDEPTLTEFANFVNISPPNAAYKVNSLVEKGYVERAKSPTDGRVTLLRVTDKYYDVFGTTYRYVKIMGRRLRQIYSEEEVAMLTDMLSVISADLMEEMNQFLIQTVHLTDDVKHATGLEDEPLD